MKIKNFKVAIVTAKDENVFEQDINGFIEDWDIEEVYDIKYSTSMTSDSDNNIHLLYSAIIIYREQDNSSIKMEINNPLKESL